jgi:ABC-2 type transport system ATP-binding protein
VADDIAMMFAGEVVLTGTLDDIKDHHHRLILRFESPQSSAPKIPGVLSLTGSGREWTAICNGSRSEVTTSVRRAGGQVVAENTASLDEIFIARAGAKSAVNK